MSSRPLLAVRADGGPSIGVGHLARCLGLVHAWVDRGGEALLVTDESPSFWVDQFRDAGCPIVRAEAAPTTASWWVEDGYHLRTSDRTGRSGRTLVIDDHDARGTAGRGADLLLDQNLGADPGLYPWAIDSLMGPRYALLRRGIRDAQDAAVPAVVRRVVVVLGGSPSPGVRALADTIASSPELQGIDVRVMDGTHDLAVELRDAHLAVAAAGTVSWELCRAGVPSVLIAVAPNQVALAEQLSAAGAAAYVASDAAPVVEALLALARDADARSMMRQVSQALVDGRGARRVACRLRSMLLTLSDATLEHESVLLDWGNDIATRAASFSNAPISRKEHHRWLSARLQRSSAATYLASDPDGTLVGLVRFDAEEHDGAEIGVTVAPDRRGQGWGGALVEAGSRRWALSRGALPIRARIKSSNMASVGAFIDADFDEVPSSEPEVLRYARSFDDDLRRA